MIIVSSLSRLMEQVMQVGIPP